MDALVRNKVVELNYNEKKIKSGASSAIERIKLPAFLTCNLNRS